MNKRLNRFFLLFLLVFVNDINGQDTLVRDSLLYVIVNEKEIATNVIKAKIDLGRWYQQNNESEKSVKCFYEAEQISFKLGHTEWLPLIYNRLTRADVSEKEFDETINKIESLINNIPDYSKEQITNILNPVLILNFKEKFEKGLDLLFDIEQYANKSEHKDWIKYYVYFFRSEILATIENYSQSRENYKKAISFARSLSDSSLINQIQLAYCFSYSRAKEFNEAVSCFKNILSDHSSIESNTKRSIYLELVTDLVEIEQLEEATEYIELGLSESKNSYDSIFFKIYLAECQWGIGDIATADDVYDEVERIIARSDKLKENSLSYLNTSKAKGLQERGEHERALILFIDALSQTRFDSSFHYRDIRYWKNLKSIIKSQNALGRLDSASVYYKELIRSIEKEMDEQAAFKTVRKNAQKKELENTLQLASVQEKNKWQKNLLWFLGVVSVLFIALGGIIWNQSKKISIEKDKSEALLLNMLPISIADRVKKGEQLIADHYESATVVFIDMVGFTTLSTKNPAQEIINLLNDVFLKIDDLVDEFKLEKIKTIGDCYMAVSGVPVYNKEHLENALLFSRKVFQELDGLSFMETPIRFKIGVETGSLIAGVIGQKRILFDLWGDTVNTASRMESSGVPDKIQVTRTIFEKMKDRFDFEPRGVVNIKGKGEIETYFLL